MIELTEQQVRAMQDPDSAPARFINPQTNETFVLLPVDEYERLTANRPDQGSRRPPRLGTLKGSILSIAPDFDDIPEGFEDYLP